MGFNDMLSMFNNLINNLASSSVFGVFMIIGILTIVFIPIGYVMVALALYTISKYRELNRSWLAWIPLLQLWVLGNIADNYHATQNNTKTNRRKKLILTSILPVVLTVVITTIAIVLLMIATKNDMAILATVTMIVFAIVVLALLGIMVWGIVLMYMSLYNVYYSNDSRTAVPYLMMSIFIPFLMPFFLLSTCDKITRHDYTKVVVKCITYLFLVIMAIIVLFPFYWMIISSLKTEAEYRATVPTFFPTQRIAWENYAAAVQKADLWLLFKNTAYVGIVSTLLSLVITILSAFAFARLEFKGKNVLFAGLLATMMIPGELFTITNYLTVSRLGWMGSFTALIVPFLVSVFYIYLLRQNFLQIPNELYLAAKVDGCSDLKYLCKVMVPLALPTLISITILKMMGAWNSYIWPKLVANDEAHRMITNGLRNAFTTTSGQTEQHIQMAAVVIVSAPLFLVFIFLRKYIMAGVSRSGIKG